MCVRHPDLGYEHGLEMSALLHLLKRLSRRVAIHCENLDFFFLYSFPFVAGAALYIEIWEMRFVSTKQWK